ncbi:hypothetical protein DSCO28_57340 [Desulfosarcina ovata subsp. sediminis]|uniref:Uncharacterized protein n=1 Tax=Desulfosarcina ovata subsp. sediminis TaxID=885957 RepID=A0A5K7ZY43_9BACT|nr:hypothetical protein DSCO28_57340 [Desulfosarcina ovata subsp. sediminis]
MHGPMITRLPLEIANTQNGCLYEGVINSRAGRQVDFNNLENILIYYGIFIDFQMGVIRDGEKRYLND